MVGKRKRAARTLLAMRTGVRVWYFWAELDGVVCERTKEIILRNRALFYARKRAALLLRKMRTGKIAWSMYWLDDVISGRARQIAELKSIERENSHRFTVFRRNNRCDAKRQNSATRVASRAAWRLADKKRRGPRTKQSEEEKRINRIARKRQWRSTHQTERRLERKAQRAKRRGLLRSSNSDATKVIKESLSKTKHSCYWCGKRLPQKGWHMDHVVPLCLGGSNTAHNVVKSCSWCNVHKNGLHPNDWRGNGQLLLL